MTIAGENGGSKRYSQCGSSPIMPNTYPLRERLCRHTPPGSKSPSWSARARGSSSVPLLCECEDVFARLGAQGGADSAGGCVVYARPRPSSGRSSRSETPRSGRRPSTGVRTPGPAGPATCELGRRLISDRTPGERLPATSSPLETLRQRADNQRSTLLYLRRPAPA